MLPTATVGGEAAGVGGDEDDKEQLLRQVVSQFVAANDRDECFMTRSSVIVDHYVPIVALPSCGFYAPISFHNLELVDLTSSNDKSKSPRTTTSQRRRRDVFTNSTLVQKALQIERRLVRRRKHDSPNNNNSSTNVTDQSLQKSSGVPDDDSNLENTIFVLSVVLSYKTCHALIQALSMMNASLPPDCRIPDEVGGNANMKPTSGTISSWSYNLARQAEQISTDVANSVKYLLGLTTTTTSSLVMGTTSEPSSTNRATSELLSPLSTQSPSSSHPKSAPGRTAHNNSNLATTTTSRAVTDHSAEKTSSELFNLDEILRPTTTQSAEEESKRKPPAQTELPKEGFCTRDGVLFEEPDIEAWSAAKHVSHRSRSAALSKKSTRPPHNHRNASVEASPSHGKGKSSSQSFKSLHWLHLRRSKPRTDKVGTSTPLPSLASQPSSSKFSDYSESVSIQNVAGDKDSIRKASQTSSPSLNQKSSTKGGEAHSSSSRLNRNHHHNVDTDAKADSGQGDQPLTEEEYDQAFFLLISMVSLFAHASDQGALCNVVELNVTDYNHDVEEIKAKASALGALERLFSIWLCNYMDTNPVSYPCIVSRSDITSHINLVMKSSSKEVSKITAVIPPIPLERGTHIYREIRSSGGLSLMTHHGLYVGGGDVIHFSGNEFALRSLLFPDQRNTKLRRTSIMTFMKFGGTLVVEQYNQEEQTDMNDAQKAISTRVMAGRSSMEDLSKTTYHRSGILFPATGALLKGHSKSWYTKALSNEGAALRAEFAYSYFHWAKAKQQHKHTEEFDPELNQLFEQFQGTFHFPPYNLFSNNCEHFCRWCKTGAGISLQVNFVGRALEAFFRGFTSSGGSHGALQPPPKANSPDGS